MPPLTLRDLDNPVFLQLPPEEQNKGRVEVFRDLTRNNPQFRNLPIEEQRKVLFPKELEIEPARPQLSFSEELTEGFKEFVEGLPGAEPKGLSAKMELGLLRMLGSPLAPLFNLSTKAGEEVLERTGSPVAAGITTATIDILAPGGIAKAAGRLRQLTARLFPLRAEKISRLKTEGVANQAQIQAEAQQTAKNVQLRRGQAETGFAAEEAEIQREAILSGRDVSRQRAQLTETIPTRTAAIEAEVAPGAPTIEAAGERFQKVFTTERTATVSRFNTRYKNIIEKGDTITAETSQFQQSLQGIQQESGILKGALPTKAETTAARTLKGLDAPIEELTQAQVEQATVRAIRGRRNSLELQDEVYNRVKDLITEGGPGKPARLSVDMLREAVFPIEPQTTVGEMIEGVLRLRAAKRAAIDSGNRNLARQFNQMETALLDDIGKASPEIKANFRTLTDDYAKEFVPLFDKRKAIPQRIIDRVREDPENIVGQIILPAIAPRRKEAISRAFQVLKDPKDQQALTAAWFKSGLDEASKSGPFDPTKFVKWWDKYVDPKTNDFVLKTALKGKYESVKGFIAELRNAKQLNSAKVADEAIDNLLKRRGVRLKDIEARRIETGKRTDKALIDVVNTRDNLVRQVNSEMDAAIKKLIPDQISEHSLWWAGPIAIVGGIGTIKAGEVGTGIFVIAGGILEFMNHAMLIRLLNSTRGAQVLRRLARSTPGSIQAVANARALENIARNLPKPESER